MHKKIFATLLLSCTLTAVIAQDKKLTMIDFVEVLGSHQQEALYYYQNNWLKLREMAVERGFIDSFQFLETTPTKEAPFTFLLITTYNDEAQYEASEDNFAVLIKERGELQLMNEKTPGEFRKVIFHKDKVKHLN